MAALNRTTAVAGMVSIVDRVTLHNAISGSESQRTGATPNLLDGGAGDDLCKGPDNATRIDCERDGSG